VLLSKIYIMIFFQLKLKLRSSGRLS